MPMIDFLCPACSTKSEHWFRSSEIPDSIPCPSCSSLMQQDSSSWMTRPSSSGFPPIYYDYNPSTGQYSFPGSSTDDLSPGFERKSITSFREYEKFRSDWERVETDEIQARIHNERAFFDQLTRERREKIRAELDRRGISASRMFDLVQKYVDMRRAARYARLSKGRPNCHVRILEFDRSKQSILD